MRQAFQSPEYWASLIVVALLVVVVFLVARFSAPATRTVTGAAYRSLLTTALTLLGLLLPFSGAALLYVLRLGKQEEAGFLLAALTLYPVVLIFAVWALAGSLRYADKNDVLEFTESAAWAYPWAYAAVYVLLVSAVVLTALFFVLRADLVLRPPIATVPATATLSRQPIRIGDSRATVLELWGKPDSVSTAAGFMYYSRPDTLIAVSVTPRGTVRSVLVGGMP